MMHEQPVFFRKNWISVYRYPAYLPPEKIFLQIAYNFVDSVARNLYTEGMETKYDPTLSVRVPRELIEKLDRMVELTGVSRAEIVERCLDIGLSDQKELMQALENPLYGALARFATHRNLVTLVAMLTGTEVDETTQKMRAAVLNQKYRKSNQDMASNTKGLLRGGAK
jgi:predicted DNA-binding protein